MSLQVVNVKSKLSLVDALRKEVTKMTSIQPKKQRLFFMGKQLEDGYKLFDYDININSLIEVSERVELPPLPPKPKVIAIAKKKDSSQDEEDKEDKENNSGASNKEEQDRQEVDKDPKMEEFEPEEDQEKRRGETAKVESSSAEASSFPPAPGCSQDNPSTSTSSSSANGSGADKQQGQTIKLEDIYDGDVKDLIDNNGYDCKRCKNVKEKNCKECGCNVCGEKDRDDDQLICDECEYYYHKDCLDPPLEEVPDGDWYCPTCFNDGNEIVKPGAYLKARRKKENAPSAKPKSKRDWGRGFACTGRTKECLKVPKNHFGPVPGVDVGMCWKYRIQVSEEGVHRPPVAGIAGRPTEGCQSIVLAGGYEDDVDHGDEFYYTGSGGRDLSGNKRTAEQSFDQELTKTNLSIAVSCDAKLNKEKGAEARDWRKGKPVRVLRSEKLKKHSKFAPEEGVRYDGIYKVVKYWPEKGRSGFVVWRYLFRRDDPVAAPWTEEGKAAIKNNGYVCVYPPNFEAAQAQKKKRKASSDEDGGDKGKATSGEGGDDSGASSPAAKRPRPAGAAFQLPPALRSAIQADKANAKVWEEILSKPAATKLDFTNLVEEYFNCLICMCVIADPVTTVCGHNLCHGCLRRLIRTDAPNCPACRKPLKGEKNERNPELQEALRAIMPGYDAEALAAAASPGKGKGGKNKDKESSNHSDDDDEDMSNGMD